VAAAARTGQLQPAKSLAYGLLCGAYVSLFSGMAWLRTVEVNGEPANYSPLTTHLGPLFLTLFCVWATDSSAYFVGRAIGKWKLAPEISPGKTLEGALGGLFFAILFGALFGWLFFRNVWLGVAIGAVAGVFGQIGDLFESALKRELGIKDFGGIMPGHGGVLDRFDSLLFVAPLSALVFQFWP
jgi:phosphatidate cytidylyltransferase